MARGALGAAGLFCAAAPCAAASTAIATRQTMRGWLFINDPPKGWRATVLIDPRGALLLARPNEDLVLSERQHRAAARALQVHDHAGVVFQPQIAAAR